MNFENKKAKIQNTDIYSTEDNEIAQEYQYYQNSHENNRENDADVCAQILRDYIGDE